MKRMPFMRLERHIRASRRLSLTPLVDIIFLLLLFFMLSSTFSRFGEVTISEAAMQATTLPKPDILVDMQGEAIRINGISAAANEATGRLVELEAAGAQTMLVMVGETLTSEKLVRFVDAARQETKLDIVIGQGN